MHALLILVLTAAPTSRCAVLETVREHLRPTMIPHTASDEREMLNRAIAACHKNERAQRTYDLDELEKGSCWPYAMKAEISDGYIESYENCVKGYREVLETQRREAARNEVVEAAGRERDAKAARDRAAAEAHVAEIKAKAETRDTKIQVLSAINCFWATKRTEAFAEIAAEKKYARIGGVENSAKLYELQQQIRKADERTGDSSRLLVQLKAPKPNCSNALYSGFAACIARDDDAPADERCGQPEIVELIEEYHSFDQQ